MRQSMILPRKKPNRLVIQLSGNYGKLLSVIIFSRFQKTKQNCLLFYLNLYIKSLTSFVGWWLTMFTKRVLWLLYKTSLTSQSKVRRTLTADHIWVRRLWVFLYTMAWLGSIHKVKRGPRKQQRNVYLNLSRNDPAPKQHNDCIPLSDELAGMRISSDWKMMTNKTNFVSFVRPVKWEFNNIRAVTEVVVSKTANSDNAFITIKAHGCQKYLSDVHGLFSLSVQGQVSLALEYIENHLFAMGLPFPKVKVFKPLCHVSGSYNDLSNDDQENINLVFSWKCRIFGVNGACCSECNKVFKMQNIKRQH